MIGYCQTYSPNGLIVVGLDNGCINIINPSLVKGLEAKKKKHPSVFRAHRHAIFTIEIFKNILFTAGTEGCIKCWRWEDIMAGKPKCIQKMSIPQRDCEITNEINKIVVKHNDGAPILYAGSGDNMIHAFDLTMNKLTQKYADHKDYIHDLKLFNNADTLASASEDGTVRLWDLRTRTSHHVFKPSKKSNTARSESYISCMDISQNDEWMVCGGGPKLTMWNLKSLVNTAVLDTPRNVQQNVVKFVGNEIIAGGSSYDVNKYTINGITKSSCITSIKNVMDILPSNGMFSVTGFGNGLDIFTKSNYRDFTFKLKSI